MSVPQTLADAPGSSMAVWHSGVCIPLTLMVGMQECASRLSADDWRRACYAVELAMERAQRIELPDGKLLVTQGTSARFIRIK